MASLRAVTLTTSTVGAGAPWPFALAAGELVVEPHELHQPTIALKPRIFKNAMRLIVLPQASSGFRLDALQKHFEDHPGPKKERRSQLAPESTRIRSARSKASLQLRIKGRRSLHTRAELFVVFLRRFPGLCESCQLSWLILATR